MDCLSKNINNVINHCTKKFNRVAQSVRETFDPSLRTHLDDDTSRLISQCEQVVTWTKMIISALQTVLDDYIIVDKNGDRKASTIVLNLSKLSSVLVGAGEIFIETGIDVSYGGQLIQYGLYQKQLAKFDAGFTIKIDQTVLQPLKYFIKSDVAAFVEARRVLNLRRLDLDREKNRCGSSQTSVKELESYPQIKSDLEELPEASNSLAKSQERYDEQLNIVKGLCFRIIGACQKHSVNLSKLSEIFIAYRSRLFDNSQVSNAKPSANSDNSTRGSQTSKGSKQSEGDKSIQDSSRLNQAESSAISAEQRTKLYQSLDKFLSESNNLTKSLGLKLSDSEQPQLEMDYSCLEIGMARKIYTAELEIEKARILKKIVALDSDWSTQLMSCLKFVIDQPDDVKLRQFFVEMSAVVAKENLQYRDDLVDNLEKRLIGEALESLSDQASSSDTSTDTSIDPSVPPPVESLEKPDLLLQIQSARREYLSTMRLYEELCNVGLVPVENFNSMMWQLMSKCGSINENKNEDQN